MNIHRLTALRHLEFHAWATQKVLDSVAPLSKEELLRDMQTSHSSVWGTLDHTYRADALWLKRLQGEGNATLASVDAAEDLAGLRRIWSDTQAGFISFAGSLNDTDWTRGIEYRFLSGQEGSSPIYETLLHVVNHGTFHRGQIVGMLRQLGAKPIATDFLTYVRLVQF
jgi:uncharacterized damage-inducible protein DinB